MSNPTHSSAWNQYLLESRTANNNSAAYPYSSHTSTMVGSQASDAPRSTVPRGTTSYQADEDSSRFAFSVPPSSNSFAPAYPSSNSSYTPSSQGYYASSTNSTTGYASAPTQSIPSVTHAQATTPGWPSRSDTRYTEEGSYASSNNRQYSYSSSEYNSNPSSINPAYLGNPGLRHDVPQRGEAGIPLSLQGELTPDRVQYTDSATDKETAWLKRACHVCRATSPPGWRKSTLKPGKIVCNACGLYEKTHAKPRPTRLTDEGRGNIHRRTSHGSSLAPQVQSHTTPTSSKSTFAPAPLPTRTDGAAPGQIQFAPYQIPSSPPVRSKASSSSSSSSFSSPSFASRPSSNNQ